MEYRYSSDANVETTAKRKKVKQSESIAVKDRQISELRAKNAVLALECELLRGKFLLISTTANKL